MVKCEHLREFVLPVELITPYAAQVRYCLDCENQEYVLWPYGYYQIENMWGYRESYLTYVDEYLNEDLENIYNLLTIAEVEDPGVIIHYIEGELENANHHDQISLVGKLYGKLVQKFERHLEVAHILKDVFLG